MSVISGNGAEEFNSFLLVPGLGTCTEKHTLCNIVIHNCEAGVAENNNFIFRYFKNISKELLALGNAVKHAVVAGFKSV